MNIIIRPEEKKIIIKAIGMSDEEFECLVQDIKQLDRIYEQLHAMEGWNDNRD